MKKLIYSVLGLALVSVSMTSCFDDILDVKSNSSFDGSNVFSNYTLAEYNIFAIGEIFGETNSYRGRLHLWYGFNNDIEWYNSATSTGANEANASLAEYWQKINNGNMNNDTNGYNKIFVGIERANLCISGLRAYADLTDPQMKQLLGEALSLRAFLYYELIKMWGDVPARFAPITNETIYVAKSDRDVIYKQILADLEEAIPYLAWPGEVAATANVDRVNKAFAMGLYARIALAASGYAWRADDGQVGTNNAGSLRLTTDPELSKAVLYPKALAYLKEVITLGKGSLLDYETLWRRFNNNQHMTAGQEVLYVIPFSNGRGRWNYTHAIRHDGYSKYVGGTKSGASAGATGPVPTLWWQYDAKDVRRDLTCVNWYYKVDANTKEANFNVTSGVDTWYWGKYRFEWMLDNPYTGGNDDGIKPIVMRYSDILLMASEMAAYTGDLNTAKNYLKEVRRRAFKGNEALADNYVNALTLGNAQAENAAVQDYAAEGTIMKAIIDERALEFAGEMLRKADLIRWGLLKIKMDEAIADTKALAQMTGKYAPYMAAAEEKKVKNDKGEETGETYMAYYIFWKNNADGSVKVFGLEENEIGQEPADYTVTEPNGWQRQEYISDRRFYKESSKAYKYDYFYGLGDGKTFGAAAQADPIAPWNRSTWPIWNAIISASQGALVNDFGY